MVRGGWAAAAMLAEDATDDDVATLGGTSVMDAPNAIVVTRGCGRNLGSSIVVQAVPRSWSCF